MSVLQPFTCFFSMKYGVQTSKRLFEVAATVGEELGLHFIRGAEAFAPVQPVWENIAQEIDNAFIVIVDTSRQSWWVSFELFYSLERKYCIPLVCDDPPQAEVPPPNSDQKHLHYRIRSHKGRTAFQRELRGALREVMKLAARWRSAAIDNSLKDIRQLPRTLVDPQITVDDHQLPVEDFFRSFLAPGPKQVAVIAPSGLGKTVLLTRLALMLRRAQDRSPSHADQLSPLVVFLRAASLSANVSLLDLVRTHIHSVQDPSPRQPSLGTYPGLFESYRLAGRICVLVDGLDEFFVLHRGHTDHLMNELDELVSYNISVVASCRENLWFQQIQGTKKYQCVRIEFTEDQANQLLAGVRLPETARDKKGKLKRFLLSPLLLSFVKTAHDESQQLLSFESRSELYNSWARWKSSAESARYGAAAAEFMNLFGAVAVELVKQRRPTLPVSELPKLMSAGWAKRGLSAAELSATGILELRGDSELDFVHPSIYEYFIAHRLYSDFKEVVKARNSVRKLNGLELAQVELDFPQSAVYGFLSEMVGPKYFAALRLRLRRIALSSLTTSLLRNLIEYLGMTFDADIEPELVEFLLSLIEDKELSSRVRFDTARALERVHPRAPHPYFEHVSDWGPYDYRELARIAHLSIDRPWVMRGHGEGIPVVGKHWGWFENTEARVDPELQRRVSRRLATLLKSSSVPEIRINVSNAWIRWYDDSDQKRLVDLRRHAARKHRKSPTRENLAIHENLSKWVGRRPQLEVPKASKRRATAHSDAASA